MKLKLGLFTIVIGSLISGAVSATEFGSMADVAPPARVPGLVTQTLNVNSIQLKWSATYDDFTAQIGIEYRIYRAEMTSDRPTVFVFLGTVTGRTSILDDRLTRRGYYAYYVVARDESGNLSQPSLVANAQN